MMMLKTKKVILTGKKQRLLHEEVYQRDGGCCAICGAPVPEGVKAHHEPPKSQGGQDIVAGIKWHEYAASAWNRRRCKNATD